MKEFTEKINQSKALTDSTENSLSNIALTDKLGDFRIELDQSVEHKSICIKNALFTNFIDPYATVMKQQLKEIFINIGKPLLEKDLPITLSADLDNHKLFNKNKNDNQINFEFKQARFKEICKNYSIKESEYSSLYKYEYNRKDGADNSIRVIVTKFEQVLYIKFFDPHHLLATSSSLANENFYRIQQNQNIRSCIFKTHNK